MTHDYDQTVLAAGASSWKSQQATSKIDENSNFEPKLHPNVLKMFTDGHIWSNQSHSVK